MEVPKITKEEVGTEVEKTQPIKETKKLDRVEKIKSRTDLAVEENKRNLKRLEDEKAKKEKEDEDELVKKINTMSDSLDKKGLQKVETFKSIDTVSVSKVIDLDNKEKVVSKNKTIRLNPKTNNLN